KYEVTNAQFGASGHWSGADLPRESVNWFAASDHCAARAARLPTEAEWAYAARGPDNLIYPWGNEFVADNVVSGGNSGGQTAPVGSRPGGASWVGALDMSGNVLEWTSSAYEPYPYATDDGREGGNRTNDHTRVLRGGSFINTSHYLRSAGRVRDIPDGGLSFGFRCARSLNSPDP
ncbi:MAG: formylglycine-generating enzyme family protein, partial [Chloroflexi bacterium]|nr:formylglycine-generating enzyme family protein [Chloroflexota bacterium]